MRTSQEKVSSSKGQTVGGIMNCGAVCGNLIKHTLVKEHATEIK